MTMAAKLAMFIFPCTFSSPSVAFFQDDLAFARLQEFKSQDRIMVRKAAEPIEDV